MSLFRFLSSSPICFTFLSVDQAFADGAYSQEWAQEFVNVVQTKDPGAHLLLMDSLAAQMGTRTLTHTHSHAHTHTHTHTHTRTHTHTHTHTQCHTHTHTRARAHTNTHNTECFIDGLTGGKSYSFEKSFFRVLRVC